MPGETIISRHALTAPPKLPPVDRAMGVAEGRLRFCHHARPAQVRFED